MKIVNTFIVGQPRSGTTSLYKYLSRVPEIYLPKQKQLYYFEKDYNEFRKLAGVDKSKLSQYYNYSLENYHVHFKNRSCEDIVMDITPSYLFSRSAAQEIFKYNPEAKIIMIFRKPLDYLRSMHHLMVINSVDRVADFNEAFKLSQCRRKKHISQVGTEKSEICDYEARVEYTEQFLRFYERFPKQNIKIMFYEDFARDRMFFMKNLFEFLGIVFRENLIDDIYHLNKSKEIKYSILNNLRGKRFERYLYKYLPARIRTVIGKSIRRIALKDKNKENEGVEEAIVDICSTKALEFLKFLEQEDLIDDVERIKKLWS